MAPGGRHAYVPANTGAREIHVFAVNPSGLALASTAATGSNSTGGLLFTNDGSRLHAFYTDGNGSQVISHAVDQGTGALTPLAALPPASGAASSPVSLLMGDGTTVVQAGASRIHTWQVGSGGALGSRSAEVLLPDTLQWVSGVSAATGAGRIFVSSRDLLGFSATDGAIWTAQLDGSTLPVPTAEAGFPGTARYGGIRIGPAGAPVASLPSVAGVAGADAAFDASGSASPDPLGGAITRYDWDFGDGSALANGGATPSLAYATAGTYTATVTVTNAAGCSTGDGVWAEVMYSCAGGGSARASATVTITDPVPDSAPAVPAAPPVASALAPAAAAEPAPLSPAAQARAAYSRAIDRAGAQRTAALRACARRPAGARAACRAAAQRAFRLRAATAAAIRTRDIALVACGQRTGAQARACTATARARFTHAQATARARDARSRALAACARRPAATRSACRQAAARAYRSRIALASARRTRDVPLARCQVRSGRARAACTRAARVRFARARAAASS